MYAYKIEQTIDDLERYARDHGQTAAANESPYSNFSLRPLRIDYEAFAAAIRKIASLHRRSRFNDYGGGLLITGLTGSGKSSTVKYYRDYFPKHDGPEGQLAPVLYVETPHAPTVKTLAEAILAALGDPASCKGTSEEKTRRIYRFFDVCKVELLLIDEFQHFAEVNRRGATREVTDWLKNLINVTRIGVVLAGMPACKQILSYNPQLARRFSAHHHLPPFSYLSTEQKLEFRGVLQSLQSELPIESCCLHSDELARRMFVASYGLIGFIVTILEEACDIARRTDAPLINLQILAQAFVDSTWDICPDELNPFSETFCSKRALDQPGEPFAKVGEFQVNTAKEHKHK